MHQRLEGTKRHSSVQVWLQALSPGAEMGALCPTWMACHYRISRVCTDKTELALEEGWPEGSRLTGRILWHEVGGALGPSVHSCLSGRLDFE